MADLVTTVAQALRSAIMGGDYVRAHPWTDPDSDREPYLTWARAAIAQVDEPTPEHVRVMADVTAERHRQIVLGWTTEHDDTHSMESFISLTWAKCSKAAFSYAEGVRRRRYLIQAIALLVAAVESMDRKAARRG